MRLISVGGPGFCRIPAYSILSSYVMHVLYVLSQNCISCLWLRILSTRTPPPQSVKATILTTPLCARQYKCITTLIILCILCGFLVTVKGQVALQQHLLTPAALSYYVSLRISAMIASFGRLWKVGEFRVYNLPLL